jgi:hypothetical protein
VRPVTASCGTTTSSGLHGLYCAYVVHPDVSSRRSTSRRSVALALVVRPVTASCGVTTRRSDCTSSTAPMQCIRTRRLATRLLIGWSHWLSPCVWSLRLTARLLVIRIALALLSLCRASGRAVSPLNLSSVGRTGSCRVCGHSIVRCEYPSCGRNGYTSPMLCVWVPRHVAWLIVDYFALCRLVVNYFTYAAHLGASARCMVCRATRRRLLHLLRVAYHVTHRRLLRLAQARRRLLQLCRTSGCLGTSRGSSHGSSSTTSTTPRF